MIDKLKSLNIINDELKSIYEFDEYTLTELLCQFYKSISDVIDECNILEESYNYLLNQGLPLEVQKEITNMYNDGRLELIINSEIFGDINFKLDKVYADNSLHTIYVEETGNDNNDGFISPVKSLTKAFSILNLQGSKCLFGQWRIKLGKGSFGGVRVAYLPQFSKPLIIEGENWDETKIEKQGDEIIGIWIEPMRGNSVTVKNIQFKGFTVGFNGYGVLGKNQGYLLIQDCKAIGCDCGFAGINNVTLTVQRSKMYNCSYGAKSLYLGACTIGAGSGGSHLSDGGNGVEIENCETGLLVSRNSVAHSDYVKYISCGTGITTEMNSRVATLGCLFQSCNKGLQIYGGAEVILGIDNEVDTFNNCTIPYNINGNGRLSRPYSLYAKNEFILGTLFPTTQVIGTTSQTEVCRTSPSVCTIPKDLIKSEYAKIRIKAYGNYKLPTSGTNFIIQAKLIGLNDDNSLNSKDIAGANMTQNIQSTVSTGFIYETELVFTPSNYARMGHLNTSNTTGGDIEKHVVLTQANTMNTLDGKKQIRLYVTPNSNDIEVNISYVEIYITN